MALDPPNLTCELPEENGVYQSADGVIDLKWKSPHSDRFELQERSPRSEGEYEHRYTGVDLSSVRSGLAEGTHRFRVRALGADDEVSDWSDALVVEVTYMDRDQLHMLLILGGLVVLMTIGAIIHGHLNHRKRKEAEA